MALEKKILRTFAHFVALATYHISLILPFFFPIISQWKYNLQKKQKRARNGNANAGLCVAILINMCAKVHFRALIVFRDDLVFTKYRLEN